MNKNGKDEFCNTNTDYRYYIWRTSYWLVLVPLKSDNVRFKIVAAFCSVSLCSSYFFIARSKCRK